MAGKQSEPGEIYRTVATHRAATSVARARSHLPHSRLGLGHTRGGGVSTNKTRYESDSGIEMAHESLVKEATMEESAELSSTPEFVFKYKMIKRIVTRKKYNNNNL